MLARKRQGAMSQAMDWLKAKSHGFHGLSDEERSAITDFALLWSLFESRILGTQGNATSIAQAVERWHQTGALDPTLFDHELTYFSARYYAHGEPTYHFSQLHFKPRDPKPMVRAVLSGTDNDPRHTAVAALLIVYRYRNNLFHGVKWQYELADQLGNFNAANAILMKALDRYDKAMP